MYKFHRVGWINADHEEISGWLCLIDTDEKMGEVFDRKGHEIAMDWMDIKNGNEDRDGHNRTQRVAAHKLVLKAHMEIEGKSRMSMVDCISFMERNAISTLIKIFEEDGEVYWNAAGGCRTTHLRDDHRGADEEIFETCINKDLVFPCLAASAVKIKKWPGGKHFYITVNTTAVDVDGISKYKTVEAAEAARKKYIKRNRFK